MTVVWIAVLLVSVRLFPGAVSDLLLENNELTATCAALSAPCEVFLTPANP